MKKGIRRRSQNALADEARFSHKYQRKHELEWHFTACAFYWLRMNLNHQTLTLLL